METSQEKAIDRFFKSGLKLNQLRILVAFAELKQVKLVADAFNVTQPAISKQIAEMEQALGVDLLKRVGQYAEFTPFGLLLTARAREIIHLLSHTRKDFNLLMSGATGSVAMGVASTVTPVLVPEAIANFHHRAPNASVSITEGTADQLFPLLKNRQLDIVVARAPAPSGNAQIQEIAIANDPLVLVVSRRHPLAFKMSPSWEDLNGNQWVLPTPASPAYQALEKLLVEHGITLPNGCIQSTSLLANAGLVSRTHLIGLLPKTLAMRYVAEGSLALVPLDTSMILNRVHLLWHEQNTNSLLPMLRECLEYCGHIHAS